MVSYGRTKNIESHLLEFTVLLFTNRKSFLHFSRVASKNQLLSSLTYSHMHANLTGPHTDHLSSALWMLKQSNLVLFPHYRQPSFNFLLINYFYSMLLFSFYFLFFHIFEVFN
uniref:Uncharacterized protein n=1 Tax=Gossypium raimondii TaxID=29730 RepID=A0A0D2SJW8_GOSRA|nr:hypothetical protein B456_010G130300 [Gossypium raimondii]